MYHLLFILSVVDGHLECFQFGGFIIRLLWFFKKKNLHNLYTPHELTLTTLSSSHTLFQLSQSGAPSVIFLKQPFYFSQDLMIQESWEDLAKQFSVGVSYAISRRCPLGSSLMAEPEWTSKMALLTWLLADQLGYQHTASPCGLDSS